MLFNSSTFLIFFACFYSVYWFLKPKGQNVWLLIASYLFYSWWDWRYLSLILFSTLIDYWCGRSLDLASSQRVRKFYLGLSLFTNLGLLGVFKYFNFFADSATQVLLQMGFKPDAVTLNVLLPVGISFYTFQTLSYTIDIYRGKLKPARSLLSFAVFVSLFPQLVAGPIERASHLLPQVQGERTFDLKGINEGLWLILLGYFKKVVIADNFAVISDNVFNNPGEIQGFGVLLGVYAFAFQIYGDFSGYSSIARGLCRLMGFDLMQNFWHPYFARNPSDFWRRWHISLSSWLRDYLYISLGGNRGSKVRTYRNLMSTMVLGGLWHGAAWNFVAWGFYHGGLLIAHRVLAPLLPAGPSPGWGQALHKVFLGFFYFQLTCLGWILFRLGELSDFSILFRALFQKGSSDVSGFFALLPFLLLLFVLEFVLEKKGDENLISKLPFFFRASLYGLLFWMILVFCSGKGYDFVYFQF